MKWRLWLSSVSTWGWRPAEGVFVLLAINSAPGVGLALGVCPYLGFMQ